MEENGSIQFKKIVVDKNHTNSSRQQALRRGSVPYETVQIQINDISVEPLESTNQEDQNEDNIDTFTFSYFGNTTIDRRYIPSTFPWISKRVLKLHKVSKEVKIHISKSKLWLTDVTNDSVIQSYSFDSIYRLTRLSKCNMDDFLAYIITTNAEREIASFHLLKCNDQNKKSEFLNTLKAKVLGFQKLSVPVKPWKSVNVQQQKRPTHKRGASSGAILMSPSKVETDFTDSVYYIGKVNISQQQAPPTFIDNVLLKLKKLRNLADANHPKSVIKDNDEKCSPTKSSTPPVVKKAPLTRKRSASIDNTVNQVAIKKEVSLLTTITSGSTDSIDCDEFDGSPQINTNIESHSRLITMYVSKSSLSLYNLESHNLLFERKIRSISFCTKGGIRRDHFGFICREGGRHTCYIFQGGSEKKVDAIMKAMKNAFAEALQASQQQALCETCPIHCFHNLCNLLEGITTIAEKDGKVHETIKLLSEYEQLHVVNEVNDEEPNNDTERIEITVNVLRELFDGKQIAHKHSSKVQNLQFTEDEMKENLRPPPGLFEKARKSLTTSFQNFSMKKVRSFALATSPFTDEQSNYEPNAVPEQSLDDESSKPRSKSLENTPDFPQFGQQQNKPRVEFKTNKYDSSSRRTSSLENVEKSIPAAVKEEQKDEFDETANKTHVKEDQKVRRESSWRQAIYQSVITPSRRSSSSSVATLNENEEKKKECSAVDISLRARSRWRNAIMSQILLIRMENENNKLAANISATEIRRQKLSYLDLCTYTAEAASAWDELLSNKSNEKVDNQILLDIIRGGLPRARRGEIWQYLIKQYTISKPDSSDNAFWMETPYRTLVKKNTTHQHAILIDLGRTFPTHAHFIPRLGSGQISLFNILKAYSLLDTEVGYCQGLSFVAGLLLMHMSEEDAFKCFCHIMFDRQIRNQYKPDMNAVQQQLYQLSRLLHDYHPKIYAHFNNHDVTPTLYAAPWFLTLYASQYPIGFVARVMDMVLLEGLEVIFKVALVLIGNHADEILECESFESIVDYMKQNLPEKVLDETDDVCNRAMKMDIKQQLNLYEVEYQLINEKMLDIKQTKEMFEKQEKALKEKCEEVVSLKHELHQANESMKTLQTLLNEVQRQSKEYQMKIEQLTRENKKLNALHNNPDSDQHEQIDSTLSPTPQNSPLLPIHPNLECERAFSVDSGSSLTSNEADSSP